MSATNIHLPNGSKISVTPVFGGLSFKTSELSNSGGNTPFPPGWTIVIHTEAEDEETDASSQPQTEQRAADVESGDLLELGSRRKHQTHRFKTPSLNRDHLFISSISYPSNNDFKPAVSPTRQIAMMLWATLWWYFHLEPPSLQVENATSQKTTPAGRPKGDWKVFINREGIFKGRHLLQKLERMGLVVNGDSSVGLEPDDRLVESWSQVSITRRHFWQLDARLYLFTLSPNINSPYPPSSPNHSRPSSPNRAALLKDGVPTTPPFGTQQTPWSTTDPFHSTSHLPTYFPPAPMHYTWTGSVRHPHRPKPPRQGEVFYTRYVPSLGETISLRVASLSRKPVALSAAHVDPSSATSASVRGYTGLADSFVPYPKATGAGMSDVEYLHKWMNDPRVAHSWGEQGPIEHQQAFLEGELKNQHSFPVIGCFDGKPFAFFEIYWVKEDNLGAHISGLVGDWDRGFHCLVGEQEFRGSHRVKVWLSALVHYCWLAESRTNAVMLEPRVDNEKLRQYCEDVGFFKEREVTFPHKQSNLMKIIRETWEAPCL